jgi:hypothetical protein
MIGIYSRRKSNKQEPKAGSFVDRNDFVKRTMAHNSFWYSRNATAAIFISWVCMVPVVRVERGVRAAVLADKLDLAAFQE